MTFENIKYIRDISSDIFYLSSKNSDTFFWYCIYIDKTRILQFEKRTYLKILFDVPVVIDLDKENPSASFDKIQKLTTLI